MLFEYFVVVPCPLVARKKLTGYSLERFNIRVAMEFIINSEIIELI